MTNQPLSAFDVAMNPPKPTSEWYGQIMVNAWFCALQKGVGKIAWDPNVVDANGQPLRRYTCIDLSLQPITNGDQVYPIERSVLAEFGEWVDICLPSLKDVGITNLQALNNTWIRCEMVATGRTYTNNNGETKDATTFKFLQVFADEATCRAACAAAHGGNGNGSVNGVTAPAQAATPANGNGNTKERETALKFLKPYVQNAWKKSGGDLDKARAELAPMLANQALLAKYFTVDSPEVTDLMAAEATAEYSNPVPALRFTWMGYPAKPEAPGRIAQ
jgi:hypothetical protein